ncbi:hypothetical protein OG948_33650 [Embleya sp. NBC_00888]|uniref:hypothetical protein n=1 Tax=Embleya sp. NBC_00888 TaxID=2975960 RepID=UPI0038699BF2|nr:hypothetical protein OG948_33650 [Embleya sp. NBC_00888]
MTVWRLPVTLVATAALLASGSSGAFADAAPEKSIPHCVFNGINSQLNCFDKIGEAAEFISDGSVRADTVSTSEDFEAEVVALNAKNSPQDANIVQAILWQYKSFKGSTYTILGSSTCNNWGSGENLIYGEWNDTPSSGKTYAECGVSLFEHQYYGSVIVIQINNELSSFGVMDNAASSWRTWGGVNHRLPSRLAST